MSTRIQSGDTVSIVSSHILDNTGTALTLLTDIEVRIRRESDNQFYDWSDETFKATPTDLNLPLSESSIVNSPGIYTLNTAPHTGGWDTAQITNETANDTYTIEIIQTTLTNAATVPQIGEIIIDQWVANIDVKTSTVSGSVWDEALTNHQNAGSTGEALSNASGNLSNIADSVWDESMVAHTSSVGIAGRLLSDASGNLTDIADAIWDEPMVLHTASVGVAGRLLSDASGNLVDIADAVWDETRSDHIAVNTFGQSLQFTSSFIDTSISSVSGNIWDIILSEHLTAGSTGRALSDASGNLANIADIIWDEPMAAHTGAAGIAGKLLSDASGNLTDIADSVWDETRSDHITANTFGESLQFTSSFIDVAISTVSGSVWDEILAEHQTAGSTGEALSDASGNLANIADTIWDEPMVLHTSSAGSAGRLLNEATGSLTDASIADAVWDELRDDHTVVGSFGESVALSASGLDTSAVNEISASILADSNKITGSFIDVAISSVSSSVVIESGALDNIANAIWDQPITEHSGAGTFGERVGKKLLTFVNFIAFKDSRKRRR